MYKINFYICIYIWPVFFTIFLWLAQKCGIYSLYNNRYSYITEQTLDFLSRGLSTASCAFWGSVLVSVRVSFLKFNRHGIFKDFLAQYQSRTIILACNAKQEHLYLHLTAAWTWYQFAQYVYICKIAMDMSSLGIFNSCLISKITRVTCHHPLSFQWNLSSQRWCTALRDSTNHPMPGLK